STDVAAAVRVVFAARQATQCSAGSRSSISFAEWSPLGPDQLAGGYVLYRHSTVGGTDGELRLSPFGSGAQPRTVRAQLQNRCLIGSRRSRPAVRELAGSPGGVTY